jgi:molecular chaperone GrpE
MKTNISLKDNLKRKLEKSLIQFQTTLLLQKEELASQKKLHGTEETTLFLEIIEVLDAFELIFDRFEKTRLESNQEHLNTKSFINTINHFKAIYRKLSRVLSSRDLQKIEFMNEQATPGLCKVIETQVHPELPSGHIVQILKHGYQKNSKIIRPAEVITSLPKSNE